MSERDGLSNTVRGIAETVPDPLQVLRVRRARLAVLGVAAVFLALKLVIAATTSGTQDVGTWEIFVDAVQAQGPVGIYGIDLPNALYNHPPLIGYYLEVMHALQTAGIPVRFSIRASSSVADVVSCLIVFELLRTRRTLRTATASAMLVAASPILLVIAGFHGNTDPIFVMLVLVATYLLTDKHSPAWAGCAIGLAVGVKLIPIVVIPALLVYAGSRGWRYFTRFAGAGAAVFLVTWGPVLVWQRPGLMSKVIGYAGASSQWGIIQFGHWAGDPWWVAFLSGPGRLLIVGLVAGFCGWIVWRRPVAVPTAVGLALAGFWALSPASATQYYAWPAAASFLIVFWGAAAYNILGGILLMVAYTRWSAAFPWDLALVNAQSPGEVVFGVVVWAILCLTVWSGIWQQFSRGPASPTDQVVLESVLSEIPATAVRPDS